MLPLLAGPCCVNGLGSGNNADRTLAGRAPEEDDAGGTNRNEGRDVGPAPPQKRPCAR